MTDLAYGIDFGGSGIKGAPVDLATGEFAAERIRIPTPAPATPEAVAEVIAELLDRAGVAPEVPVGVTVPAVVRHGVVGSAANIDDSWIDVDAGGLLQRRRAATGLFSAFVSPRRKPAGQITRGTDSAGPHSAAGALRRQPAIRIRDAARV